MVEAGGSPYVCWLWYILPSVLVVLPHALHNVSHMPEYIDVVSVGLYDNTVDCQLSGPTGPYDGQFSEMP